jgi:hypothetical protein
VDRKKRTLAPCFIFVYLLEKTKLLNIFAILASNEVKEDSKELQEGKARAASPYL